VSFEYTNTGQKNITLESPDYNDLLICIDIATIKIAFASKILPSLFNTKPKKYAHQYIIHSNMGTFVNEDPQLKQSMSILT
jgi:hypothetical protein